MKRILFFALLCSVSFVSSVMAQGGHTITIIREDGRKEVIDLQSIGSSKSSPQADTPALESKEKAPPQPALTKKAKPKASTASKVSKAPKAPQVVVPPQMPVQRDIQRGDQITRAQAILIALDYAPPSSDVEGFISEFEGVPAYSVIFKIEDGFHEVILDQSTGQVLASRESRQLVPRSVPGHLPTSLR